MEEGDSGGSHLKRHSGRAMLQVGCLYVALQKYEVWCEFTLNKIRWECVIEL